MRGVFGHNRYKVAGGFRRQHKEELHNLYASPAIVRIIKLKRK
jgi:hypothetical protein